MEVRAVRQAPTPPPVEKVVVELTRNEALSFVNGVKMESRMLGPRTSSCIARMIDEALSA